MALNIASQKDPGCFYETLNEIGKGGQGKVYKVLLKNPKLEKESIKGVFAAKIIMKEYFRGDSHEIKTMKLKNLQNELLALSSVDSPNIIKIREFIKQPNFYVIIMELSNGCSLYELITSEKDKLFHESEVNLVIRQVV